MLNYILIQRMMLFSKLLRQCEGQKKTQDTSFIALNILMCIYINADGP